MWVQAGFSPDSFWQQNPKSFQLTMRGIRKRLEIESEARIAQAWHTGAFTGMTQSKGGLKPLKNYIRKPIRAQKPNDMLAALKAHQAAGANMTIRKIGG